VRRKNILQEVDSRIILTVVNFVITDSLFSMFVCVCVCVFGNKSLYTCKAFCRLRIFARIRSTLLQ
jgi:hypothetical protein